MGFWANWKQKRKAEQKKETEQQKPQKRKKDSVYASALEEAENKKFHSEVVENIDQEIKETEQQKLDDLIEDPHLHSQGFIAPKQGIQAFVDDVVDNSNLEKKKKKRNNQKRNSSTRKRTKTKAKNPSKKS